MKKRIRELKKYGFKWEGDSGVSECGICEKHCIPIAHDASTGWWICESCVESALTVEHFLVRNAKLNGLRHPFPNEFGEDEDD